MTGSLRRITALLLRHWFLYRQSWTRGLNIIIWPAIDMLGYGFLNRYIVSMRGGGEAVFGVILAGTLLWGLGTRTQIGTMLALMEDTWSRNIGQIFVTPLRDWEYFLSLIGMGLAFAFAGMAPVMIAARLCFGFSILSLGLPLALLLMNLLLLGWMFGVWAVILIIRFGPSAEWMCWPLPFLILPISGVYYPVATLPHWLQSASWFSPATYVFEGMRGILQTGVFDPVLFWQGLGLNLVYLGGAVLVFGRTLAGARMRGTLLQMG